MGLQGYGTIDGIRQDLSMPRPTKLDETGYRAITNRVFRLVVNRLVIVLALLAPAAVARTQLDQPSNTWLPLLLDKPYVGEMSLGYWVPALRNVCMHSWWDIPSLSLTTTPMTWSIPELNQPDPAPWAMTADPTQCTWAFDAPMTAYGPDLHPFGATEPSMLEFSAPASPNVDDIGPLSIDDEVTPELTPIAGSEAARELRRAWQKLVQRKPSNDAVLVLVAHWAHETHGGRSMYNYNFGGIKGHGPDGLSCVRQAHEGSGYHVRALRDRFRAYRNPQDGAEDYLSLLIRKYPSAIDAAQRGDVPGFVDALKRSGYFTGSQDAYARSMSDLVLRAFEQGFDSLGRLPTKPAR
jgi:hypothetical protein